MSDLAPSAGNRIIAADVVDGVLTFKRYDGSSESFPMGGGGGFDPDTGGPAIKLDSLVFGPVDSQDEPTNFYQAILSSVKVMRPDGSVTSVTKNTDLGLWQTDPFTVGSEGNL